MGSRRMAPDALLFAATIALTLFGLVMLYSASVMVADASARSPFYFFGRQAVWAVLGFAAMLAAARMDYRVLNRPAVAYLAFAVVIVALLGALVSTPINGAHRWVRFFGLSFQPSEFARVALVLVLAHQLSTRGAETLRQLAFPLSAIGITALLVFAQPDLGTATLLGLLGAALLFVGGARFVHLAGLAAVAVPLFAAGVLTADYRLARITSFLDPFGDPLGVGFQLTQSLIALGAGGVTGAGLTASRQKHLFLPEPHSDFVFSVIGEELGLVGALLLVGALFLYVLRGIAVSLRAPDRFGMLLGIGAAMAIGLQAFLNVSVAVGILPTTGLPLPFVSAGGSSLLATMAAAGLLLSVSQRAP